MSPQNEHQPDEPETAPPLDAQLAVLGTITGVDQPQVFCAACGWWVPAGHGCQGGAR